ncbi:uncharacterized protein EI90DRAFT_3058679 [Cantharellus anzutake]|uniref:uncharacterized protein n=1 Tax=Cantharellus anzutake TaxID=1750568 RepID=UPI001907A36F|nr:uncharacterized protein EI90DRAFT_3058679 [Cantharellus anzutake]KAF8331131.1 hypothetical protein EI90DRAFT_3058679 [Cantharellus anzutake]
MEDVSGRGSCCGLPDCIIRRHLQLADLSAIDALRVFPERETTGSDAHESPENGSLGFSYDSQHPLHTMRQPAAPTQLTRLEAHRNFTTSLCAGFHTRGSSQQETYSQRSHCHKIANYCTTSPINISSSLFRKLCLAGESHGLLGEATSSPPCGPKNSEPSTGAHPLSG